MASSLLQRIIAYRRVVLRTARCPAAVAFEFSVHDEPVVTDAMLEAAEDAMDEGLGLRGIIMAALKAQKED